MAKYSLKKNRYIYKGEFYEGKYIFTGTKRQAKQYLKLITVKNGHVLLLNDTTKKVLFTKTKHGIKGKKEGMLHE